MTANTAQIPLRPYFRWVVLAIMCLICFVQYFINESVMRGLGKRQSVRICRMAFFFVLLGLFPCLTTSGKTEWQTLAPGMDLRVIAAGKTSSVGDSRLTVVRMDPGLWELVFAGISRTGEASGRTARDWCLKNKLTAAINAGMFATDYKTHVGYLRSRGHVNSSHVNGYQSVAAFDPFDSSGLPRFRIFDLDAPGVAMASILKDYDSVVQNLRLIQRPGRNRWPRQDKKWSAAVLGEDEKGNILFIFCRTPFSMYDLNHELLSAGIGLTAAQHLEGGPEAQLYLHAGNVEFEMFGSFETSFQEDDENAAPWPIPNVLGVRPRRPDSK